MPNSSANDSLRSAPTAANTRRALIVADASGVGLHRQLTASGYITRAVGSMEAASAIGEFNPDVVVVVVTHAGGDGENESIALVRRLRAEAATYSLPIVFAWGEDVHSLRAAAQYSGADDYFSLETPTAEILARLDSLFWRVEADRRNAPVLSDRRLEIDNFMFMLDAVREDVRAGTSGTLSLVYAVAPGGRSFDKAARDRTLSEAHSFLKLNLRRVDAVAFYGPTTLLVYLPRMESTSAVAALSRLRREFLTEHPERDIVAGLSSFPAHGGDVETLIERAERAVNDARTGASSEHVVAYDPLEEVELPDAQAVPEPAHAASLAEKKEMAIEERAPVSTPGVETRREEQKRTGAAEGVAAVAQASTVEAQAEDGHSQSAAEEAAARERDRRASGAVMPRRLLLTISDAARMAQVNSLIRSAGYEARAAFDGQQALHLLRIERPDLLLLDYELQGIDGVETIRRLRKQNGGRLSLPVVMLLSAGNEWARREALELGARSVLATPYDPADLLASLRAAGSIE